MDHKDKTIITDEQQKTGHGLNRKLSATHKFTGFGFALPLLPFAST
jgi:hypothetical protein